MSFLNSWGPQAVHLSLSNFQSLPMLVVLCIDIFGYKRKDPGEVGLLHLVKTQVPSLLYTSTFILIFYYENFQAKIKEFKMDIECLLIIFTILILSYFIDLAIHFISYSFFDIFLSKYLASFKSYCMLIIK